MRGRLFLALPVLLLSSCRGGQSAVGLPDPPGDGKVLVIGVPAVTWEDLAEARLPLLRGLLDRAAVANVSVRVSNRPADAYATLGAGQRTHTDPSAGWAFDGEEVVENGPARRLFYRRNGPGYEGAVYVTAAGQIRRVNEGRAFNARPGLLAEELASRGGSAAVIGNADYSLGALPSVLPSADRMSSRHPPEVGIHREAALAASRPDGTVARGHVGRELLTRDPGAPFGLSMDLAALVEAFRSVWEGSQLVVVETGDTARADAYSLGVPEDQRKRLRSEILGRYTQYQIDALLDEVDLGQTLVVIVAPTTPGGPEARGQLRPAVVAGRGIPAGLATSPSTRRPGLITMMDLSATIAHHLGVSGDRFVAGHLIRVLPIAPDLRRLVDANERAVVHDRLRAPVSIAVIGLQLAIYVVAAVMMRNRRLPGWIAFLLLSALAFPLASFASTAGVWRFGAPLAAAAVVTEMLALGGAAHLLARNEPRHGAAALLAATAVFFLVDLATGATAQLDSILGYTSVAAGRFFGLGNLGFALFAASALLAAGMLGDGRGRGFRFGAAAVALVALVWIGHPRLGADLGGTLAMVPAVATFGFITFARRQIPLRFVPLVVLAALALTLAFGWIDLARPPEERTHLGDFVAGVIEDPASLILLARRKITLALSLAISSRWGLAAPGAVAVFIWLSRRPRSRWRRVLESRSGLRAGLDGLIVAAVVGSFVNDSGVAVAGMMLAVAAPWALIVAARLEPSS